tara:strand:+ start:168 stop:1547 length:1380 start_codon:yes stop_codon:yes gene_type:complete
VKELGDIVSRHQAYFKNKILFTTVKDRISKIKKIRNWVKGNEDYIIQTCLKDYNKPLTELYSTEIKPVLSHVDFTLSNIRDWVSRKSVWTPFHLFGSSSRLYYEPKGACLIISPWNYPFNLTLNPLVSAIAAGNCVVLKPSEFTPHTSSLIEEMVSSIFHEDEVKVVQGGPSVGEFLINAKFDHILFTGSPEIGKIVMRAAASNLTSVTLELGGKNHAVVDVGANLKDAAEKILWSKYVNCGQTCIAVNHVFVHSDNYDNFIVHLQNTLSRFFQDEVSYGSIVNKNHVDRLKLLLDQSIAAGAELDISSSMFSQKNMFPLTVLKNVGLDNPILNSEIFGPILPVVKYDDFDVVLNYIRVQEKALALYLFSNSRSKITKFLKTTSAGTSVINDCMLQYANPYLPFGGVNNSGVGKMGGHYGFLSFSNEKSVLLQPSGFSMAKFIYPPYGQWKQRIAKFLG